MGVFSGPRTPSTEGLVFALDAGNNKSYSRNRFLCPGTIGEGAAADNNVSFAVNGTGTFVRMGYGQSVGGYTIKPTDVVYKYVMGETGCLFHGNKITVPQGSYVNFSFDYLVTGATTYPILNYLANIEDYSGGGLSNSITAPNSTQGIWQRRVMQSGPAATTVTDCNVLLYPGACSSSRLADSGTIYYRNPRVEIINYDPDPGSIGSDSGFSYSTNINLATDISGNNNNGTFTNTGNAPLYSSVNGGSWIFDGIDDYASISNSTSLQITQNITLTSWLKTNWNSNTNVILDDLGAVPFASWGLWITSNGKIGWYDNGSAVFRESATSVNTNLPVNICSVLSGTTVRFYINGVLDANSYTVPALVSNSDAKAIGRRADGGGFNFRGNLYYCSIYNRALNSNEVVRNFNSMRGRFGI